MDLYMKEYVRKLMLFFRTGGLSEESFENIRPFIAATNYSTWRVTAPLGAIYFAIVYLTSGSVAGISANSIVYLVMMTVFALASLLFHFKVKEQSPALMPLIYFLNESLLLFSIMIGAVITPGYLAVTFMVLLVVCPLITLGRPYVMEIFITISAVLFVVACRICKTPELQQIDYFNVVCFWVISLFLNIKVTSYRLRSFLWQHTIEEDSSRDALTRVRNNAAYSKMKVALDEQIKAGLTEPFALVVCDVNGLKQVNDTEGHEKGDLYLLKNCRKICRIFDHSPVYRIGGDEFLVYLKGRDYENRHELMELAWSSCLSDAFGIPDYDRINFAAGLGEYIPSKRENFSAVFKRADAEMYECKKQMRMRSISKFGRKEEAGLAEGSAEKNAYAAGGVVQAGQELAPEHYEAKRTILVVEDNDLNREMMCTLIEDRYNVLAAGNGQEALKVLRESHKKVVLILLDIIMPVMDGIEFLKVLRKDPLLSEIPVIVTTESTATGVEEKCLYLGARDFISKPYNPNVLLARINNLIQLVDSSRTLTAVEYDALTGLYTKQAFYHYAQILLRDHPDTPYDIVISDIEDFKAVNEKYGEEAGDRILCTLAQALKPAAENGALVARYSGDRFVALMPHTEMLTEEFLVEFYNRLLEKQVIEGFYVSGKIGIYDDVDRSIPVSVMCDRALMALQTIRHQYGKLYAKYDDSIREEQEKKFQIEQSMLEAYQKEQFKIYYQPKHQAETGILIGAEALIRWEHPVYGFMSPAEFIPQFEKNGFITTADYYVWNRTCKNLRRWQDMGIPVIPISVNASRRDFEYAGFMEKMCQPVQELGLDPALLHIEVTESLFFDDLDKAVQHLQECRKFGFQVELDDFGAGYSSLNALGALPLDILKLDMSFMSQGLLEDKRKMRVLAASVRLAHNLGLETLAEGVETQEQVQFLKNMGCDGIQGYYFSKPLSEEEFAVYMQEYKR